MCLGENSIFRPNFYVFLHISVTHKDILAQKDLEFCQAQPQPQLQLSWAEIALFSTNRATLLHPPTHPPTRIIERWTNAYHTWAIYQSIYISSLKLLHLDYFTNCSRLVQILFITCSHNLLRTCSQLFNIFSTIYLWIVSCFCLFLTCSLTCSWLVHE